MVFSVAGPGPSSDSPGTFCHVQREARGAFSLATGSAVFFEAAHHTFYIQPSPWSGQTFSWAAEVRPGANVENVIF